MLNRTERYKLGLSVIAAGLALLAMAGCSHSSTSSPNDLAAQQKGILGSAPPPSAAAMIAKYKAQNQQKMQQGPPPGSVPSHN